MSYEDTHCPCGDKKPTDTMLCDACVEAFKDRKEMATYNSSEPVEYRRHAAMILLALARGRKRNAARAAAATTQLAATLPNCGSQKRQQGGEQ